MYMLMSLMFLILSLVLFFFMLISGLFKMNMFFEWEMFSINSVEFIYIMYFDGFSLFFMSVVMIISSMVFMYSKSYMGGDINKLRFVYILFLFVVSMMFMILSPNLFSIMLGWDGLGMVSFCLVIYFQNVKSNMAGMLTVLSNRVGDVFLLMLLGWMVNSGSWNFFVGDLWGVEMLGVLLILVSITKSAQIPFSAWLPAAMAAPTPVSSLVHSSTLVTAGVYLLIQFFDLIQLSLAMNVLLILGVMTMFMSGLGALFEFDFKKIIALSTLSQLGLMFSTLGLNMKLLSGFHLLSHAFFKALLFLCAGVLIHSFSDVQDIRYLGGMLKYFPVTYGCFMVSNLSLMGMFFLSGFYSKDLILEMMSGSILNLVVYVLFYVCMVFSILYSLRLFYMSFLNFTNFNVLSSFGEEDYFMLVGIFMLMVFSVFMGSLMKWLFGYVMKFIYLCVLMKCMIIYLSLFGGFMAMFLLLYYYYLKYLLLIFYFNGCMWFLSLISVYALNLYFLNMSQIVTKLLDLGWIEYILKFALMSLFSGFMELFMIFQKNLIKFFLVVFIVMIFLLVSVL